MFVRERCKSGWSKCKKVIALTSTEGTCKREEGGRGAVREIFICEWNRSICVSPPVQGFISYPLSGATLSFLFQFLQICFPHSLVGPVVKCPPQEWQTWI